MAQFCPVNIPRSASRSGGMRHAPQSWVAHSMNNSNSGPDRLIVRNDPTPFTRSLDIGALINQRPLPSTPISYLNESPESARFCGISHQTQVVENIGSMSAGKNAISEQGSEEDYEGSGSKKKSRIQRFFCDNFPPCNLSFTRSEHLARHIRPFQCHCTRRFSRLDNLRQHAQTVHQNEEIPQGSLAATGTRFQRHVRTDRARTHGSRARGNAAGGHSGTVRGHNRNSLSTSSIGSVGSAYSSQAPAEGPRPTSLVMTGSDRGRLLPAFTGRGYSPNGFTTPAPASLSNSQGSPQWTSGIHTPTSSHSQMFGSYADHQTPGRRLSVQSASSLSPFTSSPPARCILPPLEHKRLSLTNNIPKNLAPAVSGTEWSFQESTKTSAEAFRRRTWHPETKTSQITWGIFSNCKDFRDPLSQPPIGYNNVPSEPPLRLPGIESFGLPKPQSYRRCEPDRRTIMNPWSLDERREAQDQCDWMMPPRSQVDILPGSKKLPSSGRSHHVHHVSAPPIMHRENRPILTWQCVPDHAGIPQSAQEPIQRGKPTEMIGPPRYYGESPRRMLMEPNYNVAHPTNSNEISHRNVPRNDDREQSFQRRSLALAEDLESSTRIRELSNRGFETPRFRGDDTVRLDTLVAAATL